MSATATGEAAAANEPGGPPFQHADTAWLVLQRLDDVRRAQDDLRRGLDDLRRGLDDVRVELRALEARTDAKFEAFRRDITVEIHSIRNWSLGLLLLAILSLSAKMLTPGA